MASDKMASVEDILIDLRYALTTLQRGEHSDDTSKFVLSSIVKLCNFGERELARRLLYKCAAGRIFGVPEALDRLLAEIHQNDLKDEEIVEVIGVALCLVALMDGKTVVGRAARDRVIDAISQNYELVERRGYLFALFFGPSVIVRLSENTDLIEACRQIACELFAPSKPIPPDIEEEVLHGVDRLLGPIANLEFPAGIHVSPRWRQVLDEVIRTARLYRSSYHVLLAGLYYGQFRPMSFAGDEIALQQMHTYSERREAFGTAQSIAFDVMSFSEVSLINAPGIRDLGGVRHSANSASYATDLMRVVELLPPNESYKTCLEIGSGYGGLARMMKLALPNVTYFLVDIPESLAFAYTYLKLGFPQSRCLIVDHIEEHSEDHWRKYDFVFCPIQLFGAIAFPKVDIGINFWSLGEMNQGCVDYIFSRLNSGDWCRRFVFYNNIFLDRTLLGEAGGESGEGCLTTLNFGPGWRLRHASFQSDMSSPDQDEFEKGVYRNSLFAIMERVDTADREEAWDAGSPIAQLLNHYFQALWSPNVEKVSRFLTSLRSFLADQTCAKSPLYSFDAIGEVLHFRH